MSAEKQVPMIYRGGLSGLWWCATRYRENPDGTFEALEKHDVTGQIEEILTEVEAERIESDAWLDSDEGQASMARVKGRLGLGETFRRLMPELDWREMFRHYVAIVRRQEGVDFLYGPDEGSEDWKADEWAAIKALVG